MYFQQESRHFYTNCKKEKHVKRTMKIDKEDEVSLYWFVTDQIQCTHSLSLFSRLLKEKKLQKDLKKNLERKCCKIPNFPPRITRGVIYRLKTLTPINRGPRRNCCTNGQDLVVFPWLLLRKRDKDAAVRPTPEGARLSLPRCPCGSIYFLNILRVVSRIGLQWLGFT